MSDERAVNTQRVAVVVFCEVESESELDAETVAPMAVRKALSKAGEWPAEIDIEAYGVRWTIRSVRAMEAGIAAGNGYLWTQVTPKAYREGGTA